MDNDFLDSLLSILPCLFPIIFIGFAIFMGVMGTSMMRRKVSEGWGSLGNRTGLALSSTGQTGFFANMTVPELRGDFEGRAVKLWTYTVSHGKSSTRYTAMQMALKNPSNYTLFIRREGGLDSIGKAFGMKDIETGDAAFDKEFVVKSTPETVARALFGGGSMVREAVRRIPRGSIEINGSTMLYKQVNLETDSETLYTVLLGLREIANAVEGTSTQGEAFAGERAFEPEVKPDSVWGSSFDQKDEYGTKDSYGVDDVDPSIKDDPFYQKKAQPDLYSAPSSDPFGPSPTQRMGMENLRPLLIGLFILTDLICLAGAAYYFFFMR